MAEKKVPNKIMIAVAALVVVFLSMLLMSKDSEQYQGMNQVPSYEEHSKPVDGDTQADTIKALQAYAKEAVNQAEELNDRTKRHATSVLENTNKVHKLESENQSIKESSEKLQRYANDIEKKMKSLESELLDLKEAQAKKPVSVDEHGIPVGFGFDKLNSKRMSEEGKWHEPIDLQSEEAGKNQRYTGLFAPPGHNVGKTAPVAGDLNEPIKTVHPAYTLAKDSVLYDAQVMTALVGRIPVDGTTPDPYPVKIFVGKENLAANGQTLPEVEGMIFSGIALGDWNLSCVSVRLRSATYIFEDGSIVNHSSDDSPLGYISDQQGWPCVSGVFKTNAVAFLRQRIGLAGFGAAGAAYADAQRTTERSGLTGSTSTSLTGSIGKLVAGTVVESTTDEVSRWLLERQDQSFDAVVVEPGAKVSIHLEKTLSIDHDTMARRVRYDSASSHYQATLD